MTPQAVYDDGDWVNIQTYRPITEEMIRRIADELQQSIANGLPAEPNWWSTAIVESRISRVHEVYLVWLAVKELLERGER